MTSEQKVTSLELSEQLKEAGAKQESEKVWWFNDYRTEQEWELENQAYCKSQKTVATFDCAELLERLPQRLIHEGRNHRLNLSRYSDAWYTRYRIDHSDIRYFAEDTPAEALGKLYLWCLKEGHCDE